MTYQDIINTVSTLANSDVVYTQDLTLEYKLEPYKHKKMDEELYIRIHGNLNGFEHREIINMEMGGINIRFICEE